MEDIMEIVKSLEKYGLLIKGVSETTQNKAKFTSYFIRIEQAKKQLEQETIFNATSSSN